MQVVLGLMGVRGHSHLSSCWLVNCECSVHTVSVGAPVCMN